jgi:hypothetical protein
VATEHAVTPAIRSTVHKLAALIAPLAAIGLPAIAGMPEKVRGKLTKMGDILNGLQVPEFAPTAESDAIVADTTTTAKEADDKLMLYLVERVIQYDKRINPDPDSVEVSGVPVPPMSHLPKIKGAAGLTVEGRKLLQRLVDAKDAHAIVELLERPDADSNGERIMEAAALAAVVEGQGMAGIHDAMHIGVVAYAQFVLDGEPQDAVDKATAELAAFDMANTDAPVADDEPQQEPATLTPALRAAIQAAIDSNDGAQVMALVDALPGDKEVSDAAFAAMQNAILDGINPRNAADVGALEYGRVTLSR